MVNVDVELLWLEEHIVSKYCDCSELLRFKMEERAPIIRTQVEIMTRARQGLDSRRTI
jgi:hypothetical protein